MVEAPLARSGQHRWDLSRREEGIRVMGREGKNRAELVEGALMVARKWYALG